MRPGKKAALLEVCLREIEAGRATEEECRARPDLQAAGLVPLLRLARRMAAERPPEPAPRSLEAGLARLQAAMRRPARSPRLPRWAVGLAALLLFLAVLFSTAAVASAGSLPGEPLYPLKRSLEDLRLTLTYRPAARSALLLDLAGRRLEEMEQVCSPSGCPPDLLADLGEQTEEAATAIEGLPEGSRADLLEKMLALTERQQEVLRRVLERAPASARPGLERALERSRRGHERARQALEKEKPPSTPGRPDTPPPARERPTKKPTATPKEKRPPDKAPRPDKTARPHPTRKP